MSEHDAMSGIRLSWPAPLHGAMGQGAIRASVGGGSAPRQPIPDALPMMGGWTLPTPPSIPSLPT